MAKITANGEREYLRYEGPGGSVVVLTVTRDTKPGRLLYKQGTSWGYQVRGRMRHMTLTEATVRAEEYARERGCVRPRPKD